QKLINLLNQKQVNPDLILLTGDLSQDQSAESYQHLAEMIKPLQVPAYCIPGNHDDSDVMYEVFPKYNIAIERYIILKKWQIILLDSQKPDAVEGYLAPAQFKFLQKNLQQSPNHHTLLALHHHPVSVETTWLDNIGLQNAEAFWDALKDFTHVRAVLFGHVHSLHEGKKNGIQYFSTPSTCIQFKPRQAKFSLDKLPPAYRIIDLYANGTVKTEVHRLDHYVGVFEQDARGY
ncbi:hypothetical protein AYO45_02530, partial [Gammaproteobacteria bacterium SCGC AG-212-F23]